MATVYFYLKFFEQLQYAKDFLAGRLWMNPLKYFKTLEATDAGAGRADKYEAPTAWLQPCELGTIRIGEIEIAATELTAPVVIQSQEADNTNVLCLYAGTSGHFDMLSDEMLPSFREHMLVPSRCLEMGSVAVLVHHVRNFRSRIVHAVRREGFGMEFGPISYFESSKYSGNLTNPTFAKRADFAWQREHRIALNRGVSEPVAYVLDVGSLDDICSLVDLATLNDSISIVTPNHE